MRTFQLSNGYTVVCRAESTRYGFRHLAHLMHNGFEVAKDKACYYNRTWERYPYETVIHGVLYKYFGDAATETYYLEADKQGLGHYII